MKKPTPKESYIILLFLPFFAAGAVWGLIKFSFMAGVEGGELYFRSVERKLRTDGEKT